MRIEKRGEHDSFEVTGWRYEGDSVWHVKVWADNRRNSYKVTSGMFEPNPVSHTEREAVLHVIEKWETEQTRIRPLRAASQTLRIAGLA